MRSVDNLADLISRGMSVNELIHLKFWLEGPAWLTDAQTLWPEFNFHYQEFADISEVR